MKRRKSINEGLVESYILWEFWARGSEFWSRRSSVQTPRLRHICLAVESAIASSGLFASRYIIKRALDYLVYQRLIEQLENGEYRMTDLGLAMNMVRQDRDAAFEKAVCRAYKAAMNRRNKEFEKLYHR